MHPILLNSNVEPIVDRDVVESIKECFSAPPQSETARLKTLKDSFEPLYQLAGVHEAHPFLFTSSGVEACNHVIFSTYLDVTRKTGKNQFITSTLEEASLILPQTRLENLGCVALQAEPDARGRITEKSIQEKLSARTALLSLSYASSQTGVVNSIAEIAELCKSRSVLFHLDVTHALGKVDLDFEGLGVDFLTFDGVHIQGPQGTGGLFVHKKHPLSAFILGGQEQGGLRGGAFSLPLLVGLGKAAENSLRNLVWMTTECARLRALFEDELKRALDNITVYFNAEERLPHLSLIGFEAVHTEALLAWLTKKGLSASSGGGHQKHLPFLLEALKIDPAQRYSALSFALSKNSDENEIEAAVKILVEGVRHLLKFTEDLKNKALE
jgi:cysteine desulfurase